MGQQQLLLLVLSTVIVGLATVAGIQAFSENQQQATQDALVQRAITIGNDVLAAHNEPSQFGGVDLINGSPSAGDVATAAGYDSATPSADGAGDGASCEIYSVGNPTEIYCSSDGTNSSSGENEYVEVHVNPATSNVAVKSINGSTVTSTI
jgi:hypothetical protein